MGLISKSENSLSQSRIHPAWPGTGTGTLTSGSPAHALIIIITLRAIGIGRRTTVGHQSIHVTGIRYESTGIATLASGGRGLGMRF